MDFKIWNTKIPAYPLIRYAAILILPLLLAFYILRFNDFNRFLVTLNLGHIIPMPLWIAITKFFSYGLHIFMNFCILLVITNRLKYSLWLVYVSFIILLVGAFLILLRDCFGIPFPLPFIAFFVKANKSFVLLVLFIAGYFTRNIHQTS